MDILYFGTVCDLTLYEQMLDGCTRRPSVAPVVFESALLNGFHQNGVNVDIHSFPMIPTFPKIKNMYFGGQSEELDCGYVCRWLKTINIPVLKQWSRRLDARRIIRQWVKTHGPDDIIMTYSIPPFLVKDVVRYGRKYSIKTVAIVPDLLENMYMNQKQGTVLAFLRKQYLKSALRLRSQYDGYVYLTESMSEIVAPDKPYTVMEGIAEPETGDYSNVEKAYPRAVMYAGRLHEKYGIMKLLDAFESLQEVNADLWLFGDGSAVEEIQKRAQSNPRIKYFGRVAREQILEYERKTTLLVNPRSVREEYTKYSFPSKTIEYMLSGTPLLTTRLPGIPPEYFEYVFAADDNDVSLLSNALAEALKLTDDVLEEKGKCARRFIVEHKNALVQSRRVIDFCRQL